jgi:hypothetical protein
MLTYGVAEAVVSLIVQTLMHTRHQHAGEDLLLHEVP